MAWPLGASLLAEFLTRSIVPQARRGNSTPGSSLTATPSEVRGPSCAPRQTLAGSAFVMVVAAQQLLAMVIEMLVHSMHPESEPLQLLEGAARSGGAERRGWGTMGFRNSPGGIKSDHATAATIDSCFLECALRFQTLLVRCLSIEAPGRRLDYRPTQQS
jgi:hypothetical protein